MDEATVVFSRKGLYKTLINARDIRSREQARKLWPMVAPDGSRQLVIWVSPTFEGNRLRRRSHFRLMPHVRAFNLKQRFDEEENERQRLVQESREHRRAKELIAAELNRRLQAGLAMPWWFKDADASDYPLEGNLLLGADAIATEHPLSTPFGSTFRLDVAVLGPPVKQTAMTLGGVEIELGHAFDGRKALIGKSLGFPLISIDISEMSLEEITPEWAQRALTTTTRNHEEGRRQTYIYLHDLLYPLYTQLPDFIDPERRHQYIVFADDATLQKLMKWFTLLSKTLGYANGAVAVAVVNGKSKQSRIALERAGSILGPEWELFNKDQCLRITTPRPTGPADHQGHLFHMTMARLLLSRANALVGYKYANGMDNDDPAEDVWIHRHWVKEQGRHTVHRVLPKRLAEPVNRLIQVVGELQQLRHHQPDDHSLSKNGTSE